ncbi:retrovirus-related pol polyprotein from transposon TNT 1-94 [Tanacetum coccineum]
MSCELNASVEEKDSLAQVWHKRLGHISEARLQVLEKQGLFCKKSLVGGGTVEFNNHTPEEDQKDHEDGDDGRLLGSRKPMQPTESHRLSIWFRIESKEPKNKPFEFLVKIVLQWKAAMKAKMDSSKENKMWEFNRSIFFYNVSCDGALRDFKTNIHRVRRHRIDQRSIFWMLPGRHVDQERFVQRVPTSSHRALLMQSRAIKLKGQIAYSSGLNDLVVAIHNSNWNVQRVEVEFEQLCIESGIARHLIVVRTPQQNRVAKHINKTLINKSPSRAIEKKTPMEMWSGHPSDYGMLRIFGCVAYKKGKLKPRAVKCVLLGYPRGVKGYRLYRLDDESPKIVTSRNVVFNESVMYKYTLKDSGAGDKSVKELQVKVELQRLNNHTPEEDLKDGDDEDAVDQETDRTPDLT